MSIKLLLIPIAFFFIFSNLFSQDSIHSNLSIVNHRYILEKYFDENSKFASGDKQICNANDSLNSQIQVIVKDSLGNPIINVPVIFTFIVVPQKAGDFGFQSNVVKTNSLGVARNFVKLGSVQGEYIISAKIESLHEKNSVIFNATARKSNWVFVLIISVFGGLVLFLFGMFLMGSGLQKSAGDKMRSILSRLTNNRVVALGVGAFVTAIIQSSSATTVMLISFVNAKLITFRNTLSVILGAGIGSTITTQLIAFSLAEYSLLIVIIGFVLYYFVKIDKIKNIGESLFGFGVLFYGMQLMSEAIVPLKSYEPFLNLIITLENPIFGIVVGALFTALIQSAAAFIGILIILASQGFLTIHAGVPLVLGSAIGTAITALLATIGTSREAYKVAMAHTVLKTFGVILFVGWMPALADLVVYISPTSNDTSEIVPRQLANTHTIFNVVLTVLALPLTKQFAWLINKMVPCRPKDAEDEIKTKFIDYNIISTPSLALNLAKQETLQMAYIVQDMVRVIKEPFFEHNPKVLKEIADKEIYVNFLRDEIKAYLIKISRNNMEESRVNETFQILYTIKELEQIADIVSTTLAKKARSWVTHDYEFSEEGKKELQAYHISTMKQLSRAIEVFRDVNLEKAKKVNEKYMKYEDFAFELEKHHFERLANQDEKTISSSKTHVVLMDMFKQISEHSTNIAKILLKWSDNKI
ncbi:MAG: hypothetical protein A2W98_08630 [Bacteroidetes bacterium GWF2_33_38]|nr:MAG: hypothetical protein A2W98_08630 [Bacteroidetes bacterium GWF2_33_38]OFY74071.1 MAG: hypothetical protein A2265_09495 [Bacteroidetes bacterium RIFOXYA12_FULL_33_9]OFY92226.1 MAG: hypothetical protein A2236_04895 [Bacteroidetes bacterium RIFOXYA2_FULL_33_7]